MSTCICTKYPKRTLVAVILLTLSMQVVMGVAGLGPYSKYLAYATMAVSYLIYGYQHRSLLILLVGASYLILITNYIPEYSSVFQTDKPEANTEVQVDTPDAAANSDWLFDSSATAVDAEVLSYSKD